MSAEPDRIDRVLDEFAAAHRADPDADPLRFLDRVSESERDELALLIDAHLSRAPRRDWSEAAYARSRASDVVRRFEERHGTGEPAGDELVSWKRLLPQLRHRAQISRETLVAELAKALGVPGKVPKVSDYYHRMEQGSLPEAGVSDRVLDSLGALVGESAERLREAGRALTPPTAGEAATFARTAHPDPRYTEQFELTDPDEEAALASGGAVESDAVAAAPGEAAVPRSAAEDWDEVDELFLGGAPDTGEARDPGGRVSGFDAAAIEARAEEVLARIPEYLWDGESLPVPVETIADSHFGLLVRDVEDLTEAPGCPEILEGQSLSGLLLASRGEIWVNAAEAREWPGRRRFTICHEVGHWELHRTGQSSLFCRKAQVAPADAVADTRPPLPVTEEEANAFAAALLIPAHHLREAYARERDFQALREMFGTSGRALQKRMHDVIGRPAGA